MPNFPPCDVYFLTGEKSGDAYAAEIIKQLQSSMPDIECAGMGGQEMSAAGAEVDFPNEALHVIGFLPALMAAPRLYMMAKELSRVIHERRPRLVVSIDCPAFSFRFHKKFLQDLRGSGTRLIHVVAPQVWAWQPKRARSFAQTVDRILCFFAFEPGLFTRFGCEATFVGHPLVDMINGDLDQQKEISQRDLLTLAPGGRRREVEALLPFFHKAASEFVRRQKSLGGRVEVQVSCVNHIERSVYRKYSDFPLYEGDYRSLMASSRCALIASGTACLEAAIIGTPHAIAYQVDRMTALMGKYMLKTKYIGLPNIVHDELVCRELIQGSMNVGRLTAVVNEMWSGAKRWQQLQKLSKTSELLGGGGAMAKMATEIRIELEKSR